MIGNKESDLNLFEFQSKFPTERDCLLYLSEQKWKNGYTCRKCSNNNYCKGIKEFDRQCTKCRYLESPTAGTLFHKIKFSLVKAFHIIYFISTNKKGITSTELGRKLGLKHCEWWFMKN